MTDDDERPTCPICLDETYGRPCETSYCAGHRVGHQRGYEAGHHDGLADGMARATAAYEAGRLAAIRAEVERAIPDLVDAVALAVDREQARRVEVHDSRSRWSFSRGLRVGVWHLQERKRRAAIGLLAATRRWLQETA